ncbi:unnamed protein product [[Candida] boidinii]|uniref:DASH complex subunit DAD2 n=1 Tax=Candida boidinii TaxID=5477 RepID=A0A9W6SZS0_CANBO|nr:hypothetical protein B5S30_g4173 [[Candida] boidinii]GME69512.1 unnamed protein product [[Candida] boidinii]GMF49559.1 unnamed protein product [[Candida] boidinii]GMG00060.1 unnamed protein product [[Candida] boidinii]
MDGNKGARSSSGVVKPTSLHAKLHNKRKELENLTVIAELTSSINQSLLKFNQDLENLEEEYDQITKISSNWQEIIRSISLASSSLANYQVSDYEDPQDKSDGDDPVSTKSGGRGRPLPETLIRIKLDEEGKKAV